MMLGVDKPPSAPMCPGRAVCMTKLILVPAPAIWVSHPSELCISLFPIKGFYIEPRGMISLSSSFPLPSCAPSTIKSLYAPLQPWVLFSPQRSPTINMGAPTLTTLTRPSITALPPRPTTHRTVCSLVIVLHSCSILSV